MTTSPNRSTIDLTGSSSSAGVPLLQMQGVAKRFGDVVANHDVDFDVRSGEVHALLGENGAGKSTLMKVLFGIYRPDAGTILLRGEPLAISSPADAIEARIGMVHQHFMLAPSLTVAENVALGLRSSRRFVNDLDKVSARIVELSDRYGLHIDPDAVVWQLAVGERQRVEIIKVLYRDAELLVLDEPTAVLTPQEVDDLFAILEQMKADGRGLVFISHRLPEVMELADRITVLRHGTTVGHTTPAQTSRIDLARMMVGRDVDMEPDIPERVDGDVRLAVRGLTVTGDRGTTAVRGVDLEVRAGEILAIAGVSGNGQRELAEAIAGVRPVEAGSSIRLDDRELVGTDVKTRRNAGLGYVPEERMADGAIGDFTVAENLMLVNHGDFTNRGLFSASRVREHCERLVDAFRVKTPGITTLTRHLSGGNIQKVIMARELDATPRVLIAAQPTRGVDIGAAEYLHGQLIEQRSADLATLLISEDLDEVLALADRIAVMYEGQVVGIVDRADASREHVGLMMAGNTTPAG